MKVVNVRTVDPELKTIGLLPVGTVFRVPRIGPDRTYVVVDTGSMYVDSDDAKNNGSTVWVFVFEINAVVELDAYEKAYAVDAVLNVR